MDKQLTINQELPLSNGKTFFTVKDGSNYVIATSFEREYVVEFEQFQKIVNNLFKTTADFITINDAIVNRRYIQRMEPTNQPTDKQRLQREEKRRQLEEAEKQLKEIYAKKQKFEKEIFDAKYGAGRWTRLSVLTKNRSKHNLTPDDIKGVNSSFYDKYPEYKGLVDKLLKIKNNNS